ncbi:MAG TPA: hypothetical protein VHA13_02650 [Gammaproteobacteria bacterium]|nr:hypothetical protein [Gammaproteobacteria bacterium]
MSLEYFGKGLASGVLYGGIGAGLFAASGAVGSAVLGAAGHAGYSVAEAAKIGAIGGAILGSTTGLVTSHTGFFSEKHKKRTLVAQTASYAAGNMVGGLLGFAALKAVTGATAMTLGKTMAAFAVGGAITMIPAAAVLAVVLLMAVELFMGLSTFFKNIAAESKNAAPAPTMAM